VQESFVKAISIAGLAGLLALAAVAANAQGVDRADTLPIAMQAQVGNTVKIYCAGGPAEIPFTPVSGSTKAVHCGDSVTIAGGRGDSYLVRTENGSSGYIPVYELPTDPCLQTRFRSGQFRKEWVPKVGTLARDDFWKFKNELYLNVTADDISVAYKCLSEAVDAEHALGGMAGYANTVAFDLSVPGRSVPTSDTTSKLMMFTQTLEDQVTALGFLDDANAAQTFVYATEHDQVVNRYNSLVDKHTNFVDFMSQRLHDLDAAAPPAAPGETSPLKGILDGTLQGLAGFTPPKHLVCAANYETSQYGDPVQPAFIYLNLGAGARGDCQEK
jgi:hypothetical protein